MGVHGARYAAHLLRGDVANARLVAVCRRDRVKGQEFADKNKLSFYSDYREMMGAKGVDAVAVVTPSPSHLEICKAALRAGKPLLVEKPVTHASSEGADLAKVLSSSGLPLMVAQTLRFNKVIGAIRERVETVGRPVRLRMAFRLPASRLYWQSEGSGAPRGTVLETGVHLFDAARWILSDEPSKVLCACGRVLSEAVEDFFSAEMEFTNSGVRCCAEIAKCSPVRMEPIDLTGDRGHLVGDARTNVLAFIGEAGVERVDLGEPVHTVSAVLNEFASRLLRGEPMRITLEDGLKAVRIAEACLESARDGAWVSLPA